MIDPVVPAQRNHKSSVSKKCWRCGRNHNADTYCFKDEVCRKCKKSGHIQRMCRGRLEYTVMAILFLSHKLENLNCTSEES